MNKQKFIECLRQPADLDAKNIQDLEKLTEEYPYFQSARTLLAKAGKINKSNLAKKYISSAAIYATDRVLLKRYLNDQLIFLNPMNVHESHEADHDRDIHAELKTVKTTSIQSKLKNNPHVLLKSKPSPAPTAKADDTPPAKPVENKKPTPPPDMPKRERVAADDELTELTSSSSSSLDKLINELYQDMKELKVNRAKFMERERRLEEEEAVDEAVKKATTKSRPQKGAAGAENKKKAEENLKDEKPASPDPKREEPTKKPSESRSARGNRPDPAPVQPAASQKASPPKKAASTKKNPESTGKKSETKSEAKPGKTDSTPDDKGEEPRKSRQNEIISNFIKSNPSISPVDAKRKTEVDLSNESTVFHPDVASEYLAEIYLKQGKKERAVQIYEALLVKFPEKSVYFADVIKKLKE